MSSKNLDRQPPIETLTFYCGKLAIRQFEGSGDQHSFWVDKLIVDFLGRRKTLIQRGIKKPRTTPSTTTQIYSTLEHLTTQIYSTLEHLTRCSGPRLCGHCLLAHRNSRRFLRLQLPALQAQRHRASSGDPAGVGDGPERHAPLLPNPRGASAGAANAHASPATPLVLLLRTHVTPAS